MSDDVKDEYDFSKAERGRFFRRSAVLVPPIRPKEESGHCQKVTYMVLNE
jgi:hypothetical protein